MGRSEESITNFEEHLITVKHLSDTKCRVIFAQFGSELDCEKCKPFKTFNVSYDIPWGFWDEQLRYNDCYNNCIITASKGLIRRLLKRLKEDGYQISNKCRCKYRKRR